MTTTTPGTGTAVDQKQPGTGFLGKFKVFLGKFMVLKGSVRELWIVFGGKLFTYIAYVTLNNTLALWLSSDLGYNDTEAGLIVFGWSAVMTLFTVFVGSLTDAIGMRKTFLLGICICLFSRLVMALTMGRGLVLCCGLLPLAIGEALLGPVMVAGVQRYTTTAQRSISFSILYAAMNVGFLAANFIFDYVRGPRGLGEYGHLTLPGIGLQLSTYRTIFLVSCLFVVLNFLMMYFCLRDGVEVTDEGVKIISRQPKYTQEGITKALALTIRDAVNESVRIFAGLWRQPGFYKFLIFLALAAFVRLIFIHMYYTYPKFGIRELGKGAPIGQLWSVNSIAIIFLVPIVGALTQKIAAYRMVVCGSAIAASSIFIMAMPSQWFQPLADGLFGHLIAHCWLGVKGHVNPYYVMIFMYVVLLSMGEAIYSPRLYEYAAAIAPKGQAASYMALSYLPFFLAKLFVAPFSGVLLTRFCPATGPRHSGTLWLIIALTTTIAPVGLIALRRFIRVHEAGRDN